MKYVQTRNYPLRFKIYFCIQCAKLYNRFIILRAQTNGVMQQIRYFTCETTGIWKFRLACKTYNLILKIELVWWILTNIDRTIFIRPFIKYIGLCILITPFGYICNYSSFLMKDEIWVLRSSLKETFRTRIHRNLVTNK